MVNDVMGITHARLTAIKNYVHTAWFVPKKGNFVLT